MNMKKAPNTNKLKYVGAALLEGESVTLIQAARLVLEIKEALGDEICTITRCREVVSLGLNAIKNKHQTVSFGTAAVECLRSKSHRRPRTLTDIRSIIHKLKKSNPELEHTSLRNLSVEECQNILMNTFTTSRQRHKARLILSGIFSFSVKRGWCDENPILRVDTPFLQEQEIPALTLKEITQLLKAAMEEFASHSYKVWSNQRQLMITTILSEFILQCSTSDFFKCTCGNNNNLNFLFNTIFQNRFNNVCRYSKKSKIDFIRNIFYSLISCKSGNFICSWIYRINLSFISPC